jgi:hypothetical protein
MPHHSDVGKRQPALSTSPGTQPASQMCSTSTLQPSQLARYSQNAAHPNYSPQAMPSSHSPNRRKSHALSQHSLMHSRPRHRQAVSQSAHLELLPARVCLHNLLQHPPIGTRAVLRDAPAGRRGEDGACGAASAGMAGSGCCTHILLPIACTALHWDLCRLVHTHPLEPPLNTSASS